jgi:hypothetical protein
LRARYHDWETKQFIGVQNLAIRGKYVLAALAGVKSVVLGASAFPQNPSGNPTLTAVALNYHTVDAVIDRYVKNPGAFR